jgi:hypothetical protein
VFSLKRAVVKSRDWRIGQTSLQRLVDGTFSAFVICATVLVNIEAAAVWSALRSNVSNGASVHIFCDWVITLLSVCFDAAESSCLLTFVEESTSELSDRRGMNGFVDCHATLPNWLFPIRR